MGFVAGKRAFIVGVATDRSIAWGIAQAMHREAGRARLLSEFSG
jgi:enoyl-[acyl-carrier protein] reductase I